jgi:hypothetical protein
MNKKEHSLEERDTYGGDIWICPGKYTGTESR